MGNHETFMKEKKRIDEETSKSLINFERRVNEGYSRSLQKRDQIKLSAQESLVRLGEVVESRKEHFEKEENDRYL